MIFDSMTAEEIAICLLSTALIFLFIGICQGLALRYSCERGPAAPSSSTSCCGEYMHCKETGDD